MRTIRTFIGPSVIQERRRFRAPISWPSRPPYPRIMPRAETSAPCTHGPMSASGSETLKYASTSMSEAFTQVFSIILTARFPAASKTSLHPGKRPAMARNSASTCSDVK